MAGIKDAHRLVKNPPKQQFVQQRPKPRLTLMEETNGTSTSGFIVYS
jgi:hypothetical protein